MKAKKGSDTVIDIQWGTPGLHNKDWLIWHGPVKDLEAILRYWKLLPDEEGNP